MIKNQDIICVSNTTWYGEYTKSTVQLMSRLAYSNRVLFIEYPFTIKDLVFSVLGKKKAPVKRMLGISPRLIKIHSDVDTMVFNLVMPPVLPVYFIRNEKMFQLLQNLNTYIYKGCLKKEVKKLNFSSSVVINAYNPFYGLPLMGKLDQVLDIYYCYDGHDVPRYGPRIFKVDEMFSKAVNGVITTSDYLNQEKLKVTKMSFVVKNGVDFDSFYARAKKAPYKRMARIVGYIGSLDHRFDIDMVEFVVKKLPEFEFHFTGKLLGAQTIKARLEKYNNVKFFPAVQPSKVPELLASYDVGIIPYTTKEYNKNIYPLKINEFLAVGVPVVMTAFAELKDFDGMVSVADDSGSFVRALLRETESDTVALIERRITFAKQNSWDNRAIEFSSVIEKVLHSAKRR